MHVPVLKLKKTMELTGTNREETLFQCLLTVSEERYETVETIVDF